MEEEDGLSSLELLGQGFMNRPAVARHSFFNLLAVDLVLSMMINKGFVCVFVISC